MEKEKVHVGCNYYQKQVTEDRRPSNRVRLGRVVEGKKGSSEAEGRVLKTKKQEVVLVCGREI